MRGGEMNEREQFEAWMSVKSKEDAYAPVDRFEVWQAATAQHQETINSLLAVIECKNALNNWALDLLIGGQTYDCSVKLQEALALTPENVRLVECTGVREGKLPCDYDQNKKRYTIEVKE
jgi:hypothetical protein